MTAPETDWAEAPVLVATSHGTADPAGRKVIAELRLAVAAARPGLRVRAAHVDVQSPRLERVAAELAARHERFVVVPLLLSTGYHVRVDIGAATEAAPGLCVAAEPLGPHRLLSLALHDRLEAAGWRGGPIVLAASGSSDPGARDAVVQQAGLLAEELAVAVQPAFLGSSEPTVAQALSAPRGEVPAVAAYLLAPGVFAARLTDLATSAGVSVVSGPLANHPAVAELVLARYDEALAGST